jgi:hypothetical protein
LAPKYDYADPTKDLTEQRFGQAPRVVRQGTPKVTKEDWRAVVTNGVQETIKVGDRDYGKEQLYDESGSPTGRFRPGKPADDYGSGFGGVNAETRLRQEFNSDPIVKEYKDVLTKYNVMESAYSQAMSSNNVSAADQALITMFNKLMDPQSVVRESEYARTPQTVAIVNRAKGFAEKLTAGGAGITNDDRRAIIEMARLAKNAYEQKYGVQKSRYSQLAKSYGFDPRRIIDVDNLLGGSSPIPSPGGGATPQPANQNRGQGF